MIHDTATLADRINALRYVTGTTMWTKVAGKERLYIQTAKMNGGKTWNGGVGYTTLYVDIATGTLKMDGCAGAATRNALAATVTAIRTLLTEESV